MTDWTLSSYIDIKDHNLDFKKNSKSKKKRLN